MAIGSALSHGYTSISMEFIDPAQCDYMKSGKYEKRRLMPIMVKTKFKFDRSPDRACSDRMVMLYLNRINCVEKYIPLAQANLRNELVSILARLPQGPKSPHDCRDIPHDRVHRAPK